MDYKKYDIFKDYNNYIIFSTGKIYNSKEDRFLKPHFNNKYYQIDLTKNKISKKFLFHRILGECFLENPYDLPTIDHIDRNSKNNDLTNLRWASRRLQQVNQNINIRNKTGIKGVCFSKTNNRYRASWRVNKKIFEKSFSLNKYGEAKAKQLAIDYRNKMIELHYKNLI